MCLHVIFLGYTLPLFNPKPYIGSFQHLSDSRRALSGTYCQSTRFKASNSEKIEVNIHGSNNNMIFIANLLSNTTIRFEAFDSEKLEVNINASP